LVGVASLNAAGAVLGGVRRAGLTVEAAEYFHSSGLDLVRSRLGLRAPFPQEYPTYLLLEMSGASAEEIADAFALQGGQVGEATIEPNPGSRLWAYREGHTESVNAAAVALGCAPVKLDVAVPVRRHAEFEAVLCQRVGATFPEAHFVTFGHLAEGNSHVNLLGVPGSQADEATDLVLRLVVDYGGSISAEHGVGQAKRPWLPLTRTPVDVATMRAIKRAFDPAGLLSPGVLLGPSSLNDHAK
jgi:FAD/FMN-containing dehydrogenase